ncbi:MAG: SPOR domain-containing protein [Nitrosomonas sp.]|nr:SPOR domain-containing protein [Nitrosomonas sp.]
MSRDYKTRKPSKAKKHNGSLIGGVLIGYTLGLVSAIAVWMYLEQAPSPFVPEETAHLDKNNDIQLAETQTAKAGVPEEEVAEVEEKPQFDFYKILPGIEEPLTEEAFTKAVEQPKAPPNRLAVPSKPANNLERNNTLLESVSSEKYFLQVGSFRKTYEAENMKARLALLGIVASVQTADLLEKGIWHRVRVGPFTQRSEVDKVRASLQDNGIEIHFIKVRNNS